MEMADKPSDHIYENMAIKQPRAQRPEAQQKVSRSSDSSTASCGWAVWLLAALSCLLLAVNIALGVLYFRTRKDYHETSFSLDQITAEHHNLSKTVADWKKNGCNMCPKNWVLFNDMCYYFSLDKLTWNSSRDACISAGGDLVTIQSSQEQAFLKQQINALHWVGLTDVVTEGDWRWLDNTPLNESTTSWGKPPDDWKVEDPTGEDCALLSETGLYDVSCGKKYECICEKVAPII
ncbi:CD209 antigen-like protein E isoform X1 [Acipenser ruthenus]|uniref:CD209 antigen-like protein E isoform X1 n=1 Tax=Acipenser ruthenus TaxID=7906 RepID=UPI0027423E31|nr:CD209 antigen-like protein E isoform X1 [Acipenser ruthenus]